MQRTSVIPTKPKVRRDRNRRDYMTLNATKERCLVPQGRSSGVHALSRSTFRFEIDAWAERSFVDVGLAYDVCGVPIRDLSNESPLPADDVGVVVAAATATATAVAVVVVALAVPLKAADEQRPAPIGPPALFKAGSGGNAGKTTKTRSGRI